MDLLQEADSRPGEYSVILDPLTAVQLNYALKKMGFKNLEEWVLVEAPKLFEIALAHETAEARGESIRDLPRDLHALMKRLLGS